MAGDSPIFRTDGGDAMDAAVAQARSTFKFMWRELSWEYRRIIPGLDVAAVKVAFKTNKKGLFSKPPEVELMWASDVQFDGHRIKGTLLNRPKWVKGLQAGSDVDIAADELMDWMYAINGKVYGGFTVDVMRKEMQPDQRQGHDAAWGLDFGEVGRVALAPSYDMAGEALDEPIYDGSQLEITEHPMCLNMVESFEEALGQNPEMVSDKDEEGWTMLQREALAGNAVIAKMLIKAGADASARNHYGETASDIAKRMHWPLFFKS